MQILEVEPFKPANNGIMVPDDSWAISDNGILCAENIEANAVVAVLNEHTGVGYLGNFSPIYVFRNDKYNQLLERLQETERRSRLGIWLGGVALLSDISENPEDIASYHYESNYSTIVIEKDMRTLSRDYDLRLGWLGLHQHINVLELNCATGVLNICYDRNESSSS